MTTQQGRSEELGPQSLQPAADPAEPEDDRVVELTNSVIGEDVDGDMAIFLHPEEEWTPKLGLRLTEYDALALRDMLGLAADRLAGTKPQAFVRLMICGPED
jgi:hypothetical protein